MFDFLWSDGLCPACHTRGARVALWGAARCRSAACRNFDSLLSMTPLPPLAPLRVPSGDFKPQDPATVRYVNHRGEERSYTVERSSLRDKGAQISAKAAPTGQTLAFDKKRVRNLAELPTPAQSPEAVEFFDAVWDSLEPVEKQIVGYHRKRKSTSPRYEAILQKHPELRRP